MKPHLTLGLAGDVMIGRLGDDCLDIHPPEYVWGDLLPLLHKSDLNLVNLETTLTRSQNIRPKVFNFKAAPERIEVLKQGAIHVVNLANNHILDFSEEGLLETLQVLDKAHIPHVGAGNNLNAAQAPCIIEKQGIKIGILGCTDNEPTWNASQNHPGTFFVEVGDLETLRKPIQELRQQVDWLILSIHWGPNMRQTPSPTFRRFAHALIDLGVDILHGHSAHVFQGVEVYRNKLILYDTGDFVDDYAIDPILRNDRSFFFVVRASSDRLLSLEMIPVIISECQVNLSQDPEQIAEMEYLCKVFHTCPARKDQGLYLDLRT